MSPEITFVSIVVAALTAAFVLFPFFQRDGDEPPPASRRKSSKQQHAYETLDAEKQRVLRSIRDLDLDYDMDKLTDSIYAHQRVALIQLYVAIARRLDELEGEIGVQRARLEDAIAAYRERH